VFSFAFEVRVINVGQGSSSLIRLSSNVGILVDAGPNQASDRLITYLDSIGIDTIRSIILSHTDADHIGEVEDLLQSGKFIVQKVIKNRDTATTITYKYMMENILSRSIPITIISTENVNIDGVTLWNGSQTGSDENHRSLVVQYTDAGKTIVIMGDADSTAEKDLLNFRANVLVIGHHGSRTSSCTTFLNSLGADIGIISVGNNTYGHPTPEALSRLAAAGMTTYRTDISGDITVSVISGNLSVNGNVSIIFPYVLPQKVSFSPDNLGQFNIFGQKFQQNKRNSLNLFFTEKHKLIKGSNFK
jgi:beta-lactamase superfamily II metal-dependent hydrolase